MCRHARVMVIGVGSDLKQSKQHMPSLLIILKYENNQGVTKPKKSLVCISKWLREELVWR